METYKVHVLDNTGETKNILVFSGSLLQDIENPKIFSDVEREFIRRKNIIPNFLTSQIHPDDSIRVMKKKIISATDSIISYDELYLFSNIQNRRNIRSIYDSIYKKGRNSLDKDTFSQVLRNVNVQIQGKTEILLEEFLLEDVKNILPKEHVSKISLGMNFASMKDESFSYNPFNLLPNFMYEGTSDNALLSLENRLLMNFSTKLIDNIIYLSFATDIFDFLERNGNDKKTIQLYYPLLAKRGIYEKSQLLKLQTKLLKETKKIMDKKSEQIYENMNLLYDVFDNKTQELPYLERGIKSLQLCIHPEEIQLLPLDAIFKNIHATRTSPFIKYNPGARRENIYRLFSISLNKYGAKIPLLKRTKIIQLSKNVGKSKQISFYIPYSDNGVSIDILLTLTENSNIYIDCEFGSAKLYDEINSIFTETVNPVLQNINMFLNQTGYQIQLFSDIKTDSVADSVEVVKMKYYCKVPGKSIALKDGYIVSVFDIIEENIAKGAILKYKRVENYEEMDAETSLIMDWFLENGRMNRDEFIGQLMDFSSIEKDEALIRINSFLGNHTIIKGKYVNSSEDILENSGFLVKMGLQYDDNSLYVEIDGIRSIEYIQYIQLYVDSILRLKLFPETTDIDMARIIKASKQISNIKEVEKSHVENMVEVTKAKPLAFGKVVNEDEDDEGLIFDYDDDDDEEGFKKEQSNDSDFISNLDEYQDATLDEVELIDMPEISSNVEKDIDEPKEEEGLVFEYEDEYEDESEDEQEDGNKKMGGSTGEELDGNLLREKNNNIFLKRLKKKEPTLYLTADVGKQYARYSRLCQSYRQPVVISDAEKQKIDNEHSGSYTNALQYGTDPNKKSWYICPRFWCLKTNTSITEEQVQSGMCGKIIPQDAKKVPPGHYVYEFDRQKHESPGFLTSDNLHPNGYCLPCCFKNWNSKLQKDIRQECTSGKTDRLAVSNNNLILKIETVPIDKDRYGFLPMNVQRFLQIDYSKVVEKDNPTILNGKTLLRYGVPQSKNKSFIGCISDIYSKKNNKKQTLSIKEMCNILIDAISIDLFIKVHNGSLPAIFRKNNPNDEIRLEEVTNSKFAKSLDISNDAQNRFFQETVSSYENFLEFIRDDKSILDYTYLWDIICMPNPKLFEVGMNLAILDVTQNDSTDNIEIICPSSAYSKMYYDSKKETVILIKNEEIFEPIYMVNSNEPVKIDITFFESLINTDLKQVLRIIRKTTQNYCAPTSSIRKYEFKRNKIADEVRLNLLKYKYTILSQLLNSQGKIIGFQVNVENDELIIIPCLPSALFNDIPIKYIDDDGLWRDYEKTRDLLQSVSEKSNGDILSKPVMKVEEDGLIVGILTETNQFIQLDSPYQDLEQDDLKKIKGTNYLLADREISSRIEDYKRVKTVKMISLETQFYSSFRSLLRTLLNEYENKEIKKKIMKYIENKNSKYTSKLRLKTIEYFIRKVCLGRVEFINYTEEVLMSLNEITNCQYDSSQKYCVFRDSLGILLCPKTHLISGFDNEVIYFGRAADELMRYKRIQTFMLDAKTFLNISKTNYSILDDEMILLESLLTKDYFQDLVVKNKGSPVNITYDTAYPKISQKYSDKVDLFNQEKSLEEKSKENDFDIICIKVIKELEGNKAENIWRRRFPSNVQEIYFNESRDCSFFPIIYILRKLSNIDVTISQVKEFLRNAYLKLLPEFQGKILSVLKKQNKSEMVDFVIRKRHTFEEMILSEGYYLTNLDIWVLANEKNIPIILFTSYKLKNLVDSVNWLRLGGEPNDNYYFLRAYTEPLPSNKFTDYHLITPPMKYSQIKGFETMVKSGLKGNSEYSMNVQGLREYLSKL